MVVLSFLSGIFAGITSSIRQIFINYVLPIFILILGFLLIFQFFGLKNALIFLGTLFLIWLIFFRPSLIPLVMKRIIDFFKWLISE